jgi:hypothetical protein
MKRVLYFANQALDAYTWDAGRLRFERAFRTNELEQFNAYLDTGRRDDYALVIDTLDEDYQQETLPFLRGRDRRLVLERKLNQLFPEASLRLAMSIGRDAGGRRDETFVFSAFTNTTQYEPWLDAIRDSGIKLRGAYSTSLLGEQVVRRIPQFPPRALVVTWTKAGLRQSYYELGRHRFSRLAVMPHAELAQAAATCAVEAPKTQQYLSGLRLFARDEGALAVLVLVDPEHRAAFAAACANTPTVSFSFIDAAVLAQAIKLRGAPEETRGERLFLHIAAASPPADQCAPPILRRYHSLANWRNAIIQGGVGALVVCGLWSGLNLFEVWRNGDDADSARRDMRLHQARYDAIAKQFPKLPTGVDNLKSVVARFNEVLARSASPERALVDLSHVVGAIPELQLENIAWSSGEANTADAHAIEEMLITANVAMNRPNDYRGALVVAQRFIAALRDELKAEVIESTMPFDLSSSASVMVGRGSASSSDGARFTVKIKRTVPS